MIVLDLKLCIVCKESKPIEGFSKQTAMNDGRNSYCKECAAQKHAAWWSNQTEEYKNLFNFKSKLRKYGLTPEDYAVLLHTQNGVCAICKQPETHNNWALAIDHCHTTNKIRGLLCMQCNHILGKAKDNTNILRAAADYLDRQK